MCGIAGIFGEDDPRFVRALAAAIHHRGPDHTGYYQRGDLHLGMTRLSIIDLHTGDQPIFNEAGDKAIVFNGEIYNYKILRQELLRAGHCFATHTDTEVILHLYEEHGERCVEHLQGMFTFAIADGDTLFVARDRLGIKPLYYAFLPERRVFLFASEIKALLRYRHVDVALDPQGLADMVVLSHPLGSRTLFRSIQALPAGWTLRVKRQGEHLTCDGKQYYDVSPKPSPEISLEEGTAKLIPILRSCVRSHLVADVGIGLTFSGGLDSSLLALMMHEASEGRVRAFTTGSEDRHPDVVHSRLLSSQVDFDHDVYIPTFSELLKVIPACVLAEERPSTLRGLPFFLLCRRIGKNFKVALNGEGADELFGGYREYEEPDYLGRFLRRRLSMVENLGLVPSEDALAAVQRLTRWASFDEYLEAVFDFFLKDRLVRHHLEIVDKYAMAASVEMRVPYMDHVFVEFANSLPIRFKVRASGENGQRQVERKYILKQAALGEYQALIEPMVSRPKLGFPAAGAGFVPLFDRLCEEQLPADYVLRHEFGPIFGKKSTLLLFELFEHIFVEHRGELPDGLRTMDFIRSRGGARPCA